MFFDWEIFVVKLKAFFKFYRHYNIEKTVFSSAKAGQKQALPFRESAFSHKYCIGKGLEIGFSADKPFGLNTLNVAFTGSMDTRFKKEDVKLCGKALKVDIVANGDNTALPEESQGFIVSSDVIEHSPNPIKALVERGRHIGPGGAIFMIVTHKECTFDKEN
ncbi:MAG: methyltransferase domain-containing protein [Planctomycetota bacterium]|nr:methyltransferase domain-containing protein [Planctomycetota bacterium]